MAQVTLTEEQSAAQRGVRVGDTLVVRLSENSSGGYRWTLTSIDSARLEMVGQRYEPARAAIGSAGARVWQFAAKTAGLTRLELKKMRPWESAESAVDTFAVDLEIAEP